MEGALGSYARIDEIPEPGLAVKYPRALGYGPAAADNPYNAWCWRTDIKGVSPGPLRGKTLAIKDNVCVAGVPMMNGSSVLDGYAPEIGATVVPQILDAAGTILGKAVCEHFCYSGEIILVTQDTSGTLMIKLVCLEVRQAEAPHWLLQV